MLYTVMSLNNIFYQKDTSSIHFVRGVFDSRFFTIAQSFRIVDTVHPVAVMRHSVISVQPMVVSVHIYCTPMPVSFRCENGRLVCTKKRDHPGKAKNKGKHMDMEYCFDSDEYPDPHRSYSKKYDAYR